MFGLLKHSLIYSGSLIFSELRILAPMGGNKSHWDSTIWTCNVKQALSVAEGSIKLQTVGVILSRIDCTSNALHNRELFTFI